jgi:K+-transporting ATPase ATPase A chain
MPWLNAAVFLALLLLAASPLARYMHAVFEGRLRWRGEAAIYRWCGIDAAREMAWAEYVFAALALSLVATLAAYAIMRTQQWHGHFFNPQGFGNVDPWIAWNTAVSFVTTTDWQFYSGESTMSYLSQMAGLAWLNFIAGAVGLAAGVAVIRGFARKSSGTLGNFWVDCVRGLIYVLLPLCIVFPLLFEAQGIPQNFSHYITATNAAGFAQSITGGPIASQEAPKLLGGNGGGFVAANSASPNENPNGLTNLLELLAIWLIPAAFPLLFGRMIGNQRAGRRCWLRCSFSASAPLLERSSPNRRETQSCTRWAFMAATWKGKRFASGSQMRASPSQSQPIREPAPQTSPTIRSRRLAVSSRCSISNWRRSSLGESAAGFTASWSSPSSRSF